MPSIGPMEMIVILAIALIVFGPKRLPELGKSLGSGMREFKDSITARHAELPAATETVAETADERAGASV
jgi:sec-independent protein translocase protein TatA